MIIWRDLEERAEVAMLEAEAAGIGAHHRIELIEELESQRLPLRRRVAAAIVGLGLRLDSGAVEAFDDARLPA